MAILGGVAVFYEQGTPVERQDRVKKKSPFTVLTPGSSNCDLIIEEVCTVTFFYGCT